MPDLPLLFAQSSGGACVTSCDCGCPDPAAVPDITVTLSGLSLVTTGCIQLGADYWQISSVGNINGTFTLTWNGTLWYYEESSGALSGQGYGVDGCTGESVPFDGTFYAALSCSLLTVGGSLLSSGAYPWELTGESNPNILNGGTIALSYGGSNDLVTGGTATTEW